MPYDPATAILIEYQIAELKKEFFDLSTERDETNSAILDVKNVEPEIADELKRRIADLNRKMTKIQNEIIKAQTDLFMIRRKKTP
jgi:predicted  nucleic acid-binding Zn-ribbon protein